MISCRDRPGHERFIILITSLEIETIKGQYPRWSPKSSRSFQNPISLGVSIRSWWKKQRSKGIIFQTWKTLKDQKINKKIKKSMMYLSVFLSLEFLLQVVFVILAWIWIAHFCEHTWTLGTAENTPDAKKREKQVCLAQKNPGYEFHSCSRSTKNTLEGQDLMLIGKWKEFH